MSEVESLINIPVEHCSNIFGQFDEYAKVIEKTLKVTIIVRDSSVKVIGAEAAVQRASGVLNYLYELSKRGNQITRQNVDYSIAQSFEEKADLLIEIDSDTVCRTIAGRPIKPKTFGQKEYVDAIRDKMIVFGVGPAGTGKTYLAMAMAINAFKNNEVNKIILTRPAIEAGEKLGFLPGDLQSKVDPYLRPLYDALFQIMGAESFNANMEKGLIEVAPLAYMRGRTLDNAFIILDEAQNTTPAQMKMFLTRIGFGSKVVVTGDMTQKDLPRDTVSGLEVATKVLSKVEEIAFIKLMRITRRIRLRLPREEKQEREVRQEGEKIDMTINIEYEAEEKLDLDYEKIITDVVNEAVDYEKCPYEAEVNVTIVDSESIHEINKEYRNIDSPTDVLSFPGVNYVTPSDFDAIEDELENNAEDYFNPDTGELLLGDIVLCVQKIKEQADKYGHSEKRELAFLTAHSMMHLFGYDHMTPEESAVMEAKQNEVLERLGITR